MDIISVGGADTTKDFQVYVDNNTSGSGNSIHGGSSKLYGNDVAILVAGTTLEISGVVSDTLIGTANSFIQLRTETGATVEIDNLRIEYLPAAAVFAEDFTVDDAATLFSTTYKALPDDGATAMYYITGGTSGLSVTDGKLTIASARFTIGNTTPTVGTTGADTVGTGIFDLSKPYKVVMDIISVGGTDTTKDFQIYVDNNTSSSGNSIHGGASKFYGVDVSTLSPGTLEVTGLVATANSFLQIRTETNATVEIDNLRIEYIE